MLPTVPDPLLSDWIPYKLSVDDGQLTVRWLYVGDNRFTEPFFDETIIRCKSYPYNTTRWHAVSTVAGLIDAAERRLPVEPTAFIFHVSRCGSTLLSQLLAIPDQHIVLSEVPLIDELLRLPYSPLANSLSTADREAALRAVIGWLGTKRTGNETQLFIKMDSWNLFFHETIRRLYPTVPFILLYRSPDDVVRSHQKRRGMQAVPGLIQPELFGFDPTMATSPDLDGYTAAVLDRYLQTMLTIAHTDTRAWLLNYQANGAAMLDQLLDFLSIDVDPTDKISIMQRSRYHAKYPNQPFDETRPQQPVPAYLESAMNRYRQLDAVRQASYSFPPIRFINE
jgi:hypothetical protein